MTTNIDYEAAQAFQVSINCSLFADDVTDLTERFAAHRRRERERCVKVLRDQGIYYRKILSIRAADACDDLARQLESEEVR